jgi:hypothetical protein
MNQPVLEAAEREIVRAIKADEQANIYYYQVIKSFIPGESATPKARFNSTGLKELDTAWIKLNDTRTKLRRAYMKLYSASI